MEAQHPMEVQHPITMNEFDAVHVYVRTKISNSQSQRSRSSLVAHLSTESRNGVYVPPQSRKHTHTHTQGPDAIRLVVYVLEIAGDACKKLFRSTSRHNVCMDVCQIKASSLARESTFDRLPLGCL